MSFTVLVGALTLSPAIAALILVGIARWRPDAARLALAVAAVGALIPAVVLLVMLPDLAYGSPLQTALFWGVDGKQPIWFAPALRVEHFAALAAFGLVFLIVPLLLWMVWRTSFGASGIDSDADDALDSAAGDEPVDGVADEPESEGVPMTLARPRGQGFDPRLVSLALVLGIESAGLMVALADNLLWLGFTWTILAVLVWALGEVGTAEGAYDVRGLIAMALGPVLWTLAMLLVAGPLGAARLYDLMGHGGVPSIKVVLVVITLALAGGAYPFTSWVRRRAAFTPPAGLAATLVVAVPATLFLGARTYSALTDGASLWPQLGASTPPVTIGIAFALLGAITVAANGLLALGRTDSRSLLALLASAQVGWGFLALGTGTAASATALVLLLATTVLALSGMVAALHAGEVITVDIEPESAGPRAVGAPQRPLLLFAWVLGGLSLIGVPLLAGFSPRELLTAASLHDARLNVPLLALTWGGDILLLIAFVRATIPALATAAGQVADDDVVVDEDGEDNDAGVVAANAVIIDADPSDDAEIDVGDEDGAAEARERDWVFAPSDGVPAAFGILALALGIAPQVFLGWTGLPAAGVLVQSGLADGAVTLRPLGYSAVGGAWLPTAAWIAVVLLALVMVALREGTARVARPVVLSGQEPEALAELANGANGEAPEALAAPVEVWSEVKSSFTSGWANPTYRVLLLGVEDEVPAGTEAEDAADEEEDGATTPEAEGKPGATSVERTQSVTPRGSADTPGKGQAK